VTRLHLWPRSLAGRTAAMLLLGLMLVQGLGLTIHALDRVELQGIIQAREIGGRTLTLWRNLILTPPERRAALLADIDLPPGLLASYDPIPVVIPGMPPVPPDIERRFRFGGPPPPPPGEERIHLDAIPPPPPLPPRFRPREILAASAPPSGFLLSMRFPDVGWLNLRIDPPAPRPWHSESFLYAFIAMSLCAASLILWGVRRLTRPVAELAAAADALGRDVNAPPLPESGPLETSTAARAFNTMASRIRRFVEDRTQMIAAIGHDLRTPITRLRLRAEFMEDDDQRAKMLKDLAEMEAMIDATLAFARDDAAKEPSVPFDLAALCQTVLDEAADAAPDQAEKLSYDGPDRLRLHGRPAALKRALANLVANALKYAGDAKMCLTVENGAALIRIEDTGPGIPESEQERAFQPFRRLEDSRNRETGGTGLGLTIARNILRAHGGDVVLRNRPEGGLSARVTLPLAS
jgi:signal transduction histidine kinase